MQHAEVRQHGPSDRDPRQGGTRGGRRRFIPNIHKDNISEFNALSEKHFEFVEQLKTSEKIIAEGRFPDRDGSILILDGDVDPEQFDNDPGIQSGILLVDRKKLWVAKGSFCEK